MVLNIKELILLHDNLRNKIYKGPEDIDFKSFAEIYDQHEKLLYAFSKLQEAFIGFHSIPNPQEYYLRFGEHSVEIVQLPEYSNEH